MVPGIRPVLSVMMEGLGGVGNEEGDPKGSPVVRLRGVEPPLRCRNKDLNLARLPIPPQPQDVQGAF